MVNIKLERRNKILNYLIIICCVLILFLAALYFTIYGTSGLMGNATYAYDGKYKEGELIDYANTSWYVISENNKSYTLLRQNALSAQEINELGIVNSVDGSISYDYNSNCNQDNDLDCSVSLDTSLIGKILTAYQKSKLDINDLVTVDDYTIRLINMDDINRLKNYDWLYLDRPYWTMINPNYGNTNIYTLDNNRDTSMHMVYDGTNGINGGLVRPVINVLKMEL